jgi:gamma-glutamyl-gamma-aminobutyrate hydrolase PuuD
MPRDQRITIGCSYKCGFLYRFRLRLSALSMGHRLNFVNMRNYADPKVAMEEVDGVLIPGGADISPHLYLDQVTPELAEYTKAKIDLVNFTSEGAYRDPYEFSLLQAYSSEGQFERLPLLGICRGMQMMAVSQGIPLYLDIKSELGIKNRINLFDRIEVGEEDSLMRALYGSKRIKGFKLHHQGVRMSYYSQYKEQWPNVRITSTSNAGLIGESIEYLHRPGIGVQYHPEKSFSSAATPLYQWFLTKACENKTTKDNL